MSDWTILVSAINVLVAALNVYVAYRNRQDALYLNSKLPDWMQ